MPCGFMTSQFLSIPDAELFQMKVYEPPFWIHFPRDGGYRKDNCSDVLNCQNFERCRLMSMIDWQQSAGISQLRARTMVHAKSFLGWCEVVMSGSTSGACHYAFGLPWCFFPQLLRRCPRHGGRRVLRWAATRCLGMITWPVTGSRG